MALPLGGGWSLRLVPRKMARKHNGTGREYVLKGRRRMRGKARRWLIVLFSRGPVGQWPELPGYWIGN